MKVNELYRYLEKAIKDGKISEDSEVIAVGEYSYGDSLGTLSIENMSLIDDEKVIKENVPVVALSINAYLHECEDLGCSRMWVTKQDLEELRKDDIIEG